MARWRTSAWACVLAAAMAGVLPCARGAGLPGGARCGHDAIVSSLGPAALREPRHAQAYAAGDGSDAPSSLRARAAQASSSEFAPLRMVPLWGDGLTASSTLPAAQVETIKALVVTAISTWSGLLSVRPVVGALFASPQCAAYNADGSGCAKAVVDSVCTGAANDTAISFTSSYPSYLAGGGGAGLAGADFGLFVTATASAVMCSADGSGTVAYALLCGRDQYDRPTWGRINVCPATVPATGLSPIDSASAFRVRQFAVAHELGHVLGWTAQSFALFRNPADLSPRTPRDPVVGGVSKAYQVKISSGACTGLTLGIAAANTVAYVSERGTSCAWNGDTAATSDIPYGVASPVKTPVDCVARLVTPAVAAATQAFFGCPALAGAELENQDPAQCYVQGSHLEQRVHAGDLMASYATQVALISPVMLAAFQDSGWCV